MIIRKQQMQVFEETRLPQFEDYMVEHLKDFSPLFSESLGNAGMRSVIQAGMKRAAMHGFTFWGPVRLYIETTILLGIDFATDPQYPWATEILGNIRIPDQTQRAGQLYEELTAFLDAVRGPDGAYSNRAIRVLRVIPLETGSATTPAFVDSMLTRMREVHPEKVNYVGEQALGTLIARAIEEGGVLSISTGAGVSLLLGLMFVIGHGCVSDPKFPWIASTLCSSVSRDPSELVQRLYAKSVTYLDHVLANIH